MSTPVWSFFIRNNILADTSGAGAVCNISADSALNNVVSSRGSINISNRTSGGRQNREQEHLHYGRCSFLFSKNGKEDVVTPTLFQGNGFYSTFPKWDEALKQGGISDIGCIKTIHQIKRSCFTTR